MMCWRGAAMRLNSLRIPLAVRGIRSDSGLSPGTADSPAGFRAAVWAMGGAKLTARGGTSDKFDRASTYEEEHPDDREPMQTLEDETNNRHNKPEDEQNDDESSHAILPNISKSWAIASSLTYLPHRGDVEVRACRTTPGSGTCPPITTAPGSCSWATAPHSRRPIGSTIVSTACSNSPA
jgi:hypothetical protein